MSDPAPNRRAWQLCWLLVFVANLPLPLFLALDVTRGGGAIGMCVALALVWLCGHVFAPRVPVLSGTLAVGGTLLALGQFVPIAHMGAGLVALYAVESLSPGEAGALSEVQGFFVTVLTAGELLLLALVLGVVVFGFDRTPSGDEAEPLPNGGPNA